MPTRIPLGSRSGGHRSTSRRTALVAAAAVMLGACGGGQPAGDGTTTEPAGGGGAVATDAAPATAEGLVDAACAGELEVVTTGRVGATAGAELSGLVASRARPGVLWVHNDSGSDSQLVALDEQGTVIATYDLGVEAVDWEDVAIRPDGGDAWTLVVGDIGDNAGARSTVLLRLVAEPDVDPSAPTSDPATPIATGAVATVTLGYPDGPHDAEAIAVDPRSGELVLLTKEGDGPAQLYVAAGDELVGGATVTLRPAGTVPIAGGPLAAAVTAMDIAPDGSAVAVRSYGGVHLFAREEGQDVADALARPPCTGPLPPELQGEAIAFAADGRSYLTVSEGEEPLLHRTD